MTNKELRAELDAMILDYLNTVGKESPYKASKLQPMLVALLTEVAKRLPDEPSEVGNGG